MNAPCRLAGDLWAVFNGDEPNERFAKFVRRSQPAFRRLVESLILHPQTIVPTDDYMSLAVLLHVFGVEPLEVLLESGRVRFARLRGSIGYVGGGRGLDYFEVLDSERRPRPHAAPLEEAVATVVEAFGSKIQNQRRFAALVTGASEEIEAAALLQHVRDATYNEIGTSEDLRAVFGVSEIDLDNLPSVPSNQVRIFGGIDTPWTGDAGDVVMAIATVHLEARIAELTGAVDVSTTTPVGHVLRAQLSSLTTDTAASFAELIEMADVPDVGEAVLTGAVSMKEILRLVETRNGEQFQEWFHQNCRSNVKTTAREYGALLRDVAPPQKFSVKVIRFITTALLSKIPVVGEIASGLDMFFLDRWLRGNSPKYFIEDLSQLLRKDATG